MSVDAGPTPAIPDPDPEHARPCAGGTHDFFEVGHDYSNLALAVFVVCRRCATPVTLPFSLLTARFKDIDGAARPGNAAG